MDIYSLIDTALKIGLGALIAGVATYLTTKLSADKEKEKFILEHRIKTIELASERIEDFFDAWLRVLSRVGAVSKRRLDANAEPGNFTDGEMKQVKERDSVLVEAWSARNSAISRFQVLGATDIVRAIDATNTLLTEFRNLIIFEKKVPSLNEFETTRSRVNEHRREVQSAISVYYQSVCS